MWAFILMRYKAIEMASPEKYFGVLVVNIMDQATSKRCQFLGSAMPFY